MVFEFHWINDAGKPEMFRTSCVDMAELFMHSSSGFPPLAASIRRAFQEAFGMCPGAFADLLRTEREWSRTSELSTDLAGLIVRWIRPQASI